MNNKQLAQDQLDKLIKEVEKLKAIINEPNKTKEERFFELIQGLTPKWDKERYPTSIFYFKGDKFMLVYDQETEYLEVRYKDFWTVFGKEYGLSYIETEDFLKVMIADHFKWKKITPDTNVDEILIEWEEHFKWQL